MRAHLASRVAKWWIPERWAFVREVPKTSVGKFDKKALRAMHAQGQIEELVEKVYVALVVSRQTLFSSSIGVADERKMRIRSS